MFTETLQDHVDILSEINVDTKLDSSHLSAIGSLVEALGEVETNNLRYRKLRAWMVAREMYFEYSGSSIDPGDPDEGRCPALCGPTFDAAVDALPEPGEPLLDALEQDILTCPDDELLERAKEDGRDPAETSARVKAILKEAVKAKRQLEPCDYGGNHLQRDCDCNPYDCDALPEPNRSVTEER